MAKWDYTLKVGRKLRSAIASGDIPVILNQIENAYIEIHDEFPQYLTTEDLDEIIEEIEEVRQDCTDSSDWEFPYDAEENVDYLLDNLYNLCDDMRIWVDI